MLQTIMALEKAAMERWYQGDPDGFLELSASEVTYFDPDLELRLDGIETLKTRYGKLRGNVDYQSSEFIDPKVQVHDQTAVLTYNYVSTRLAEDGSVISRTPWNCTEVYCQMDDHWKIIHTHWGYTGHRKPDHLALKNVPGSGLSEFKGMLRRLMELEHEAMERWRRGDPWGFTDISAPEVTYFDSGTERRLDGLDALKAEYATREGKIHYQGSEFINPKVQVHGNTAVLTYNYISTVLDDGGAVADKAHWNCTEVFSFLGGQWRIIHTHWSYIKGIREN